MSRLSVLLAVIAVLAAAAALIVLLLPISSAGVDCGNVIAPHHHQAAPWFIDKGGLFYPLQNPADAAPVACDAAAATHLTIAIVLGAIAAAAVAHAVFIRYRARKNKAFPEQVDPP